MQTSSPFSTYFTYLWPQTPVLVALVAALVIVILKWQAGSRGSIWALAGLLLWLVSVLCVPLGSLAIQSWTQKMPFAERAGFYTANTVFWSLVRAASFSFLVAGVFAGRRRAPAAPLPPVPQSPPRR